MLLRQGVNPDYLDNEGRTPLSYAAGGWFPLVIGDHERVAGMLLQRADVNPERLDNRSRTPLSYPAAGGSRRDIEGYARW